MLEAHLFVNFPQCIVYVHDSLYLEETQLRVSELLQLIQDLRARLDVNLLVYKLRAVWRREVCLPPVVALN